MTSPEIEWQPIESAPKGKDILVFNSVTGPYVSCCDEHEWPLGFWGGRFGQWFPRPTHWSLLPAPPSGGDPNA